MMYVFWYEISIMTLYLLKLNVKFAQIFSKKTFFFNLIKVKITIIIYKFYCELKIFRFIPLCLLIFK